MSSACTWVESVEVLTGPDPVGVLTLLPDVSASLIYGALDDGGAGVLMAVGAHSRAQYHFGKQLRYGVRVRIRAGQAWAVLGVPAAELTDRFVPVGALRDARGLPRAEELAALVTGADVAGRPSPGSVPFWAGSSASAGLSLFPGRSVVLSASPSPSPGGGPDGGLSDAIAALAAGAPTGTAADRLGVSERQLRTVFAREVGLSPKHAARILRLRRVLSRAGHDSWAAVADETGFFDQAHLITDFRSLMGVSPGAWTAGRLPRSGPCVQLRG